MMVQPSHNTPIDHHEVVRHVLPLAAAEPPAAKEGQAPGITGPRHVLFFTTPAPSYEGPHGELQGLRPTFIQFPSAEEISDRQGAVVLEGSEDDVRQLISQGLPTSRGIAIDWSLQIQMDQALPHTHPIQSQLGEYIWVFHLPRNPTVPTISYPEMVAYAAHSVPQALSPLRAAVLARVSDLAASEPVWDTPAYRPTMALADYLTTETEIARQQIHSQIRDLHIVLDDSGFTQPRVFAMPNKKSVTNMVDWVGRMVLSGQLDEPSNRLFCSFLPPPPRPLHPHLRRYSPRVPHVGVRPLPEGAVEPLPVGRVLPRPVRAAVGLRPDPLGRG